MMEISEIKKIIANDENRRKGIITAKRYYINENDIAITGASQNVETDPIRNADNRISHNFHQLLVDEKASYMFTYPVLFDIDGNSTLTKQVNEVLGDEFESVTKDLCIEASNTAAAFLHYWINTKDNIFEYALVESEQVIPKYSSTLKKELVEVYRYYQYGNQLVFEHWTDQDCTMYTFKGDAQSSLKLLSEEVILHQFECVPFIEFKNNRRGLSDLSKYKNLIDLYDRVTSGFANDLEDIQQIIYIIENYGGADLKEFVGDLKRYKAIKTDNLTGNSGGVKTLQIEIPVEARKVLLEMLKKQIYESGQGLQQDVDSVGNASGVALKFFYRKLELKAGLTETEFKKGFTQLIKAILKFLNVNSQARITQTFTRNMISNDFETAQIAQASVGILPLKLILTGHPWVENPEEAMALLDEEMSVEDPYQDLKEDKDDNDA